MNVLFKLSNKVVGFENDEAVKVFFSDTLVNENNSFFHAGRKIAQLKANDNIYFTYTGKIISSAIYTGESKENTEDEFPYGYKLRGISIASNNPDISNDYPEYFTGQAPARYIDNDNKLQIFLDNTFNNNQTKEGNNIKQPLNQILYGPPGTGKTYNTINKAIEIIENRTVSDDEDRIELKNKYDEYRKNGQIEFITFHQSYGYEEFVEGIKADLQSSEIKYKLEQGIFKKLSDKALNNFFQSKDNNIKQNFDVIFKKMILDKVTTDTKLKIKMKKSNFYIKEIDEKKIYFDKSGGDSQHVLLIKNLKEMYDVEENKLIKGGLSQYYDPLLEYLLTNSKTLKIVPLHNYIIIIDEINRGNISKIFGELITLIEPSKRIGAEEEIMLKLPNSSEPFGVPSNLYIISTMNTADRSISQIDTALRRRFVFEEMMPNSDLFTENKEEIKQETKNEERISDLKVDGINIRLMLNAINERIEYIYDREHTVGHSYFMSLIDTPTKEKLDEIFRVSIIPLLAEYFYGDWGDIKTVLNDNDNYFITEMRETTYIVNSDRKKDTVYLVNKSFKDDGYENIYKKKAIEEQDVNS